MHQFIDLFTVRFNNEYIIFCQQAMLIWLQFFNLAAVQTKVLQCGKDKNDREHLHGCIRSASWSSQEEGTLYLF